MGILGANPWGQFLAAIVVCVLVVLPGLWAALLVSREFPLDVTEIFAVGAGVTIALAGMSGTAAHYSGAGLMLVIATLAAGVIGSGVVLWRAYGRNPAGWVRPAGPEKAAKSTGSAKGRKAGKSSAASKAADSAKTAKPSRSSRRSGPEKALVKPGGWLGLGLAGYAALLSLGQGQALVGGSDQFYHLAAVRSLIETGRGLVTDPIFGTSLRQIDPTSGAWHSVMAAICKATGIDPLIAIVGFTAVGTAVFVASLWSATKRVSDVSWIAGITTPLYFLVYHLGFFRNYGMASHVSWGMAILALVMLTQVVTSPSWRLAAAASAVGYGVLVTHLGSGQLFLAGWAVALMWAILLVLRRRIGERHWEWQSLTRMAVVAVAAVVASLPLVLPRLAGLKGTIATGGAAGGSFGPPDNWTLGTAVKVLDPRQLPGWPMIAVLGLVLTVYAAVVLIRTGKGQREFAALSLGSLMYVVLVNPAVMTPLMKMSGYSAYRLSGLLAFSPYVAIAWGVSRAREVLARPKTAWARWVPAAALVLVAAAAVFLVRSGLQTFWAQAEPGPDSIRAQRLADVRTEWGQDAPRQLRRVFGNDWPTVAGFLHTGYQMAGIANVHAIAIPEGNTPFYFETRDGPQRRAEMLGLVQAGTPEDVRRQILEKWGARFVVVDAVGFPSLVPAAQEMAGQTALFKLVYDSGGVVVFEVLGVE